MLLCFYIEGSALAFSALTPGQKAWLGYFAIRMLSLSPEQQKVLGVLKSCRDFESPATVPPPKPPTTTKIAAVPLSIISGERDSALFRLTSEELTKQVTPLHNFAERAKVWENSRKNSILFFPSVKWLRWYLGDAVGFYFAWLLYYCIALIVPSSFGLLTWLLIAVFNFFHEDHEIVQATITPSISLFRICYGLVVIIWAIACTKIWRRQQAQLAEDWLSPALSAPADVSAWVNSPMEKLRPSFRGEPRRSPITADWELHFPAAKRRILYLISGSITLLCVVVALFANVLLLNLEVSNWHCFYFIFVDRIRSLPSINANSHRVTHSIYIGLGSCLGQRVKSLFFKTWGRR